LECDKVRDPVCFLALAFLFWVIVKFYKQVNNNVEFSEKMTKEDDMLEELQKIRTLLEPKPAPPAPPPPKGLWKEFIDFISKYKVMGLAVAFILGVYLGALVQALVKDFIMPIIGMALSGAGIANLSTLKFGIPPTTFDEVGNPPAGYTGQVFGVGDFLVALITFVIVAFVVFLLVKITKKWGIE
jgi:large conductance mechanosensitive channel